MIRKICALLIVLILCTGCANRLPAAPAQDSASPDAAMAEQEPAPVPEDTLGEDNGSMVTTPVLIRHMLMGGLVRGEWLDADAFYRSGAVDFDGYRYDLYLHDAYIGEATGGPFIVFWGNTPLGPEGDVYGSSIRWLEDEQLVSFVALSADADWDLYPRPYTEQSAESPEYQALVENMLLQAGISDPVTTLTQVVTADLDGDGTDEVLLSSGNATDSQILPWKKGDNSIVVFHRMSGGQSVDQIVDSYIFTEDPEGFPENCKYPEDYETRIWLYIKNCVDLDGDGSLEVVIEETDGISAVTDSVYKLIDGRLVLVGSNGIGW